MTAAPTRRVVLGERVAVEGRVIAQDDATSVVRLEVDGHELDVPRGGQLLLWEWEGEGVSMFVPGRQPDPEPGVEPED